MEYPNQIRTCEQKMVYLNGYDGEIMLDPSFGLTFIKFLSEYECLYVVENGIHEAQQVIIKTAELKTEFSTLKPGSPWRIVDLNAGIPTLEAKKSNGRVKLPKDTAWKRAKKTNRCEIK